MKIHLGHQLMCTRFKNCGKTKLDITSLCEFECFAVVSYPEEPSLPFDLHDFAVLNF